MLHFRGGVAVDRDLRGRARSGGRAIVTAEDVLGFWIGERSADPPSDERVARWFAADPVLDAEIERRFAGAVTAALVGDLDAWAEAPPDRVALIVLLDQFPRNLFRNDPRAFQGDPKALALSQATDDAECDALHPLEHYFVLLPTMHAEDLAAQRAGEAAYARAAETRARAFRPLFENGLDFATRHRVVIERFGRFPHRNEVLGRESTAEERTFLEEEGPGF
jgi:uncharacterized protein (DUF924 family)